MLIITSQLILEMSSQVLNILLQDICKLTLRNQGYNIICRASNSNANNVINKTKVTKSNNLLGYIMSYMELRGWYIKIAPVFSP